MKKLLVLVVIAALTVPAKCNGSVLQIFVNGVMDPPDSTITLLPSETVVLSIYAPQGWVDSGIGFPEFWGLMCYKAVGTITGGVARIPPAPTGSSMPVVPQWATLFLGQGGVSGEIVPELAPSGVYFDGIIFHCESAGDAVINLWFTPDYFETITLEDHVIIHQIPEPATMLLLGLGGLLLKKRRQA